MLLYNYNKKYIIVKIIIIGNTAQPTISLRYEHSLQMVVQCSSDISLLLQQKLHIMVVI